MRHSTGQRVGFVVDCSSAVGRILHGTVALIVVDRYVRSIDWNLQVVGSQPMSLRISIREYSALQKFVSREVDSRND